MKVLAQQLPPVLHCEAGPSLSSLGASSAAAERRAAAKRLVLTKHETHESEDMTCINSPSCQQENLVKKAAKVSQKEVFSRALVAAASQITAAAQRW